MKTNSTLFLPIASFIMLCSILISCKEKTTNKIEITKPEAVTNVSAANDTDTESAVNLEEIPFELPDDWVYANDPIQELEYLKGFASNKAKGNVTVTVWDFPLSTQDSVMLLFKSDMAKIGREVQITIKDTLIEGLTITPETKFKWIGKTFERKEKICLVAVGATELEFPNNQKMIETIFNSIIEK